MKTIVKQQSAELISLLQFTQEDFQKLVCNQESYDENSNQDAIGEEEQHFKTSRFVTLSSHKSTDKYAKKRVFFTQAKELTTSKPINFYNHGCPVTNWKIDDEKVKRNNFQVFVTGDAFSVISPNIEISGANIIIHVGLEHATYSPLVLIQEALQLTRCAYEHGARSITIALPEQFHPVVHCNDFNRLLMSLFKVSGANKIYYYDKNYTGKLDAPTLGTSISFSVANQADPVTNKIDRRKLQAYLQAPNEMSLDQQVMHFSREQKFKRTLAKFSPNNAEIVEALCGKESVSEIKIPEITVRPHILLCCSANKSLAQKIADSLRLRGEMVKMYFVAGQGEQALIPDEVNICGAIVTIVQSTRPNPDSIAETREYQKNGASAYLFEAAIVARQAQLRGAETINLINPYQFSARSDKAEDNAKGKTGAYVQQNGMLLEASGVNHVITAECHDNHTMSGAYTGKKIKGSAISALSHIAVKLASEWLQDANHSLQGQLRLVTPDAGAAKRTKELTELLQAILGDTLCRTRVLGEKQRDSHKDDSALISSMNSGAVGINPHDKYLITDDETATGNTLCQAVENLSKNGAKNIAVVIVHNNISLDWLQRQLCLTRFFYHGVNDLHFSDTHEMGTLAKSYDDLVESYVTRSNLSKKQVEEQVFTWFKDNICKNFADKSDEHILQEFDRFKSMFTQLETKIRVHSLAQEFANKVTTHPYMANPHAFASKVNDYIKKITHSQVKSIVAYAGANLPAAAAAACELGFPLQVIGEQDVLPQHTFALIGVPHADCKKVTGVKDADGDFVVVANNGNFDAIDTRNNSQANSLAKIELIYNKIKQDPNFKDRPIKLLGVGVEGQVLAGELSHLLYKKGNAIGMATIETNSKQNTNTAVYTGQAGEETCQVDRNSLGMGDVCIAVGSNFSENAKQAIENLASNAKIHCPYYLSIADNVVARKETDKKEAIKDTPSFSRCWFFHPHLQTEIVVEKVQCALK